MIALDARVLIARSWPSDQNHTAAMTLLDDATDQSFVAHTLTLAEVLVGAVRAGRGEEMLADLRAAGIEEPDRREGEALRLANLRVRTGLKLPDCCVLDTALEASASLATLDAALARAARRLGVAVLPD